MILRAFYIAVVVGSLLNLINQWSAIWAFENINYVTMSLTYCVPFSVSLFSSWLSEREHKKQGAADASLPPEKTKS